MERREPTQKALVLAGGGARGSYQVGVWRALMELDWHPQIITGTSVGGLNGAMFVLDLYETARDMWLTIRSRDVMELPEENADLSALHQFLRRVVKEGGMDVTPLEEIVERVLDEDALRAAPIRFGIVTVEQRGLRPRELTTRIGDELCDFVTEVFLQHGAPAEIAWKQKPHVGTDLLRGVITSIRREIESLGGEVHFNTALTGLERKNGRLVGITTTNGSFACETLVFAVGHSARDTFSMLMDSGLVLECKPFSVGFRAEHLQTEIEKSLYHEAAGHPALPRGEYQLSQHVGDRCVYTFCMCPGGQVVASASEEERVVTNGMSYHARSGKNANAAVVVSVGGADFANDPRRAIAFQRELEAKAYAAGRAAGAYAAPAENVQSFLEGRGQLRIGSVQPTYDRGVTAADLGALLPGELADTLRAGLRAYERKIAGYTAPDAILTGLETRTSSPVRLKREDDFVCTQLAGLYPCGEGAGYAGGIMSAAVDGLRVARAIISRYAPAEG